MPSNKRRHNPGYKPGDHWVTCDISGEVIRASDAVTTWDNLVVRKQSNDPRHPQEFIRGLPDRITPDGPVRPEPADVIVPGGSIVCVAGILVAGVAVAGTPNPSPGIPEGTF